MRRDFFIQNDSGGLSVLAAASADRIIEDQRRDDSGFVERHEVMLLELYGDDSMPVRAVVGEPLTEQEDAEWLACATGRIDTPDGRLLVMGGFDPSVLGDWADGDPDSDATGVGVVQATPGSYRVDIYAHVGSMNGREILCRREERPGAFFRRTRPGRPFPLWLVSMLEFTGEDDPGHEDLWDDVKDSVRSGRLEVDMEQTSALGFLVHFTPLAGDAPRAPEGGWIELDTGAREPEVCPLGIQSEAADPDLDRLVDELLAREKPAVKIPPATKVAEVIEVWSGDPMKRVEGMPVSIPSNELNHLYYMMGLTSDSPPLFELWVTTPIEWTPPAATPELAVERKGERWVIGSPASSGGWALWHAADQAASGLTGLPDGATFELGMAAQAHASDPEVGRAFFGGTVRNGSLVLEDASPTVSGETLAEAVAFVRALVTHGKVPVRSEAERTALEATASLYGAQDDVEWADGFATFRDDDVRMRRMLGSAVFRKRFGAQWKANPTDDEDEDLE